MRKNILYLGATLVSFASPTFAIIDTYLECTVLGPDTEIIVKNTKYLLPHSATVEVTLDHVNSGDCFFATVTLESGQVIHACSLFEGQIPEMKLMDTMTEVGDSLIWVHHQGIGAAETVEIELNCKNMQGLN